MKNNWYFLIFEFYSLTSIVFEASFFVLESLKSLNRFLGIEPLRAPFSNNSTSFKNLYFHYNWKFSLQVENSWTGTFDYENFEYGLLISKNITLISLMICLMFKVVNLFCKKFWPKNTLFHIQNRLNLRGPNKKIRK